MVVGTGCLVTGANQPVTGDAEPTGTPSSGSGVVEALGPISLSAARIPVRLGIPVIGVSSSLLPLGLNADRTVEVPVDPDVAGWYSLGARPGDTGSSVILGHVDSQEGPAVFARLAELERGARLRVSAGDGTTHVFVVTSTATYRNADFPAQRVYARTGGRFLTVVTCGGRYDADRGGYQSNVVVYSRLLRSR